MYMMTLKEISEKEQKPVEWRINCCLTHGSKSYTLEVAYDSQIGKYLHEESFIAVCTSRLDRKIYKTAEAVLSSISKIQQRSIVHFDFYEVSL